MEAVIDRPKRRVLIPSGVLGMLLFVGAEVMLFAGFISAFSIVKTSAPGGIWPPLGQPRLPIGATAFNTAILLLSGLVLYYAYRRYEKEPGLASRPLLVSILLGTFFVFFQGMEWAALLAEGLTLSSSTMGSFFYLIVGMHALHAVSALVAMVAMYVWSLQNRLTHGTFASIQIFWYFVVGIWPFLYWQVYL
jgi:cytochrome c oxidase subunit 3